MDEHSVRHKSLRVLWPSATLFLLANIGLALLTAVCFRFRLNLATVALLYLIVIVLLSLKGSFVASAVVCVVAVLCLEYFFAPPISSLRVSERERRRMARNLFETPSRIDAVSQHASEILTDVKALAHELHSPRLEYLDIAAVMRSFCKEYGERESVEIDFSSGDLPNRVPPDIALCLFRVLQEALHNAVKHSEVRQFEVKSFGNADTIHLTVCDSGVGFDPEVTQKGSGLGLESMRERLKLVKGMFSIDSQPQRGTRIRAEVALSSGRT